MPIAYKQDVAEGTPMPMFGSYDETGLDFTFCFDRFARFVPYGFDEELWNVASKAKREETLDWGMVDWSRLHDDCLSKNRNRYEPTRGANRTEFWMPTENDLADLDSTLYLSGGSPKSGWRSNGAALKKRSAVVLQMDAAEEWTVDTVQYVRSLIQELSLHSGAEYEVIILVEIKDTSKPLFTDSSVYRGLLYSSAPREFTGNTLLFNRALFDAWYPKTGKRSTETDTSQLLQLLSILRPDIEHFWQFQKDVRYTGHHYQYLETIATWSQAQPRRLLWERSSRYFVPAVHGNWTSFLNLVESTSIDGGIWGPIRTQDIEPIGPDPPVKTPQLDEYSWGVGEEADLITVAPIVDATGRDSPEATVNYPAGASQIPSRMATVTIMNRFSKRLLSAMHHGQASLGTYMPADKFAASTALHHGLKAVAFPLPVYLDYAKAPADVETEFNSNNGRDIYDDAKKSEEIGNRMTCYPSQHKGSNFADELYKRWLGYGADPDEKLCLPGILLHSIKGV
ncbi:MAG: hypothetical protein Q9163_001494 [Psora crenata]